MGYTSGRKLAVNVTKTILSKHIKQYAAMKELVNLSHSIIKKSLNRVDSDGYSVGVLDFSKQKLM